MDHLSAPEQDGSRRIGRGVFLATVASGLSSLYWGKAAWGHVSGALNGVSSVLGPGTGWRIYTVAATMPRFDRASWKLRIGGLVEQPLELSYDELRALPQATQVTDFHCVTGWTVANVHWRGVRFGDLLAQARPLSDAHALEFVSAEEPYVDYLTLDQALLPDVMLAWEMEGKPLRREHGAPVRVVIPDMYGYKNVKWVAEINLVAGPTNGYWENLGYDRNAWVGGSKGTSAPPRSHDGKRVTVNSCWRLLPAVRRASPIPAW